MKAPGLSPSLALADSRGQTALGAAVWQGRTDTARRLLDAGADVDATNAAGETLLHEAVGAQDSDSALFLLHSGADTNARWGRRAHCTHGAGRLGWANLTDIVLFSFFSKLFFILCLFSFFVLEFAIKNWLVGAVGGWGGGGGGGGGLKAPGLSPSLALADSRGQTALGAAVWQGRTDTARRLLDAGADVDATNAAGETLLHEAVGAQDSDSALFLLHSGADTNARWGRRAHCTHGAGRLGWANLTDIVLFSFFSKLFFILCLFSFFVLEFAIKNWLVGAVGGWGGGGGWGVTEIGYRRFFAMLLSRVIFLVLGSLAEC